MIEGKSSVPLAIFSKDSTEEDQGSMGFPNLNQGSKGSGCHMLFRL